MAQVQKQEHQLQNVKNVTAEVTLEFSRDFLHYSKHAQYVVELGKAFLTLAMIVMDLEGSKKIELYQ